LIAKALDHTKILTENALRLQMRKREINDN